MKYDHILCMMVDDSVKIKDMKMTTRTTDKSYGKYKLPNGDIVEVIDRKNVHGIDSFVYKNKSGVHFARADWFMDNAVKVRDNNTIDKAIRSCDSRVSTRNVVTSNIAFEEIKKMTGIIPEKVQQKGDIMEFYHSGVKVAEWDMNNAEVKVFV